MSAIIDTGTVPCGLECVEVLVKDWQRAMSWYREKLGLEVVEVDEADRWCRLGFTGSRSSLTLWQPDADQMPPKGSRFIPILSAVDIHETRRDMERRGVVFTEGIRKVCGNRHITTFLDCEGNVFQLIQ